MPTNARDANMHYRHGRWWDGQRGPRQIAQAELEKRARLKAELRELKAPLTPAEKSQLRVRVRAGLAAQRWAKGTGW